MFLVERNPEIYSCCPTPNCDFMFEFDKTDGTDFKCPSCKKKYCLVCRVPFHEKMTCKEYQITNTETEDDIKFKNFVKGAKYKMCPKCNFWVSKTDGCDYM